MAKPPSQDSRHSRIDRQNAQTALDRALENTTRSKKANAQLVAHLKAAIMLYLADERPAARVS